jgi:hypothetical protein
MRSVVPWKNCTEQPGNGGNEGLRAIKRTHEFVILAQLADGRGAHQYECFHTVLARMGHCQSLLRVLYREGMTQNEKAVGLADRDFLGVSQIGHGPRLKSCFLQDQTARLEQLVVAAIDQDGRRHLHSRISGRQGDMQEYCRQSGK